MGLDVSTGVGEVASLAESVISRLWPDKTKQEQAQLAAAMAVVQGQLDANKAEAAQPGVHFRDGAGWVCVAAMGWAFVLQPFLVFGLVATGHGDIVKQLPALDIGPLWTMLLSLLGLGTMHVAEQLNKGKG